ncbi:hypothetical protein DXG03_002264, partial [Asterophora parasitica]
MSAKSPDIQMTPFRRVTTHDACGHGTVTNAHTPPRAASLLPIPASRQQRIPAPAPTSPEDIAKPMHRSREPWPAASLR